MFGTDRWNGKGGILDAVVVIFQWALIVFLQLATEKKEASSEALWYRTAHLPFISIND